MLNKIRKVASAICMGLGVSLLTISAVLSCCKVVA